MKKRFMDEQTTDFLREATDRLPVKELRYRHGFSEARYNLWRSRLVMSASDAERLR